MLIRYKGEWVKGKMHGKGILLDENKIIQEGEWIEGEKVL